MAFGLPEGNFPSWRPQQPESILGVLDSPSRFVCYVQPTGTGKSLSYITMGILSGTRTCVLTSTKGLMTQLVRDFPGLMVEIKGRGNYLCDIDNNRFSCDEAPCTVGYNCPRKQSGGCPFYDQLRRAQKASIVVTNYAFYLHTQNKPQNPTVMDTSLGKFGLLVLDEAHDATSQLENYMEITIQSKDVRNLGYKILYGLPEDVSHKERVGMVRYWAGETQTHVEQDLRTLAKKELLMGTPKSRLLHRQLKAVSRSVANVLSMTRTGKWVVEEKRIGNEDNVLVVSPVSPGKQADKLLFQDIPKVFFTSATVRPKTLELLGVKVGGNEDVEYREWDTDFPIENRLVYHIPTVRVNFRTSESDMVRLWVTRVRQSMTMWDNLKGIVHTTSYKRAQLLLDHLPKPYCDWTTTHTTRDIKIRIQEFKNSPPPKVVVSPSLVTGWDFPNDECRWQVVGKIPFPDTRSLVMQERVKADKEYGNYLAMQALVQACGRGMRSSWDYCVVFVIDDNFQWFIRVAEKFAPKYWLESVRRSRVIVPPKKGLWSMKDGKLEKTIEELEEMMKEEEFGMRGGEREVG
jgi:Rad3-related DNA helicase